jgi:hypothetical protein
MDYGMSDAEERAVFGWDDDVDEDFDHIELDVDDQIKSYKEEGNWPWWK